ncbi:hypothetical protein ACIF80_04950 [Streptomyces sp. NPDC085927]|uniref:hypothetical protein n=1 Tax=Streptomyces sp. NPDC085927 TaxID=3365738 RepID=UPI0037D78AF2
MSSDALKREMERVVGATRAMIAEYCAWDSKRVSGETASSMYGDMFEFVNLRMETAESCLLLIENDKIADSLGLSRSLLEHYLLFLLMCRGNKYFQLADLSGERLTEGQFKARLREEQAELARLQDEGKSSCLEVRKYRRAKHRIMYVYEGLKDRDDPDFMIPIHFFQFQEFRPEVMRLKEENYFQYYEPETETKQAIRGQQDEEAWRYKHYLSYDALLQCLELNGLADPAVLYRIEAHYTFLGKFLHPTHGAVRDLHERSNWHNGQTGVGIGQPYTDAAKLLAALYVCFCVAGLLGEVAGVVDRAPAKYYTDSGTADLWSLIRAVSEDYPYFWFLFNDAPLYDRFLYCIHHASEVDLVEWGGYAEVPLERVPFNQHIYSHFRDGLNGWSNIRWGSYNPAVH